MVAKKIESKYIGGRTREWLKIKTTASREEMISRRLCSQLVLQSPVGARPTRLVNWPFVRFDVG
jgi:hypothetical protein